MKTKKWKFVHEINDGWWLHLTSDEDVIRYINDTNDRYDDVLSKIYNGSNVKISPMEDDFTLLQAGKLATRKYKTSILKI